MTAGGPVEYPPFAEWREVRIPSWANEDDRFVIIRVRGDSLMSGDGRSVHNGDYAVVHLTDDVTDGALAAVLTPAGMTLRFLFREPGKRIRLQASSPDFPPDYFDSAEIVIQGRVIRTEHDW